MNTPSVHIALRIAAFVVLLLGVEGIGASENPLPDRPRSSDVERLRAFSPDDRGDGDAGETRRRSISVRDAEGVTIPRVRLDIALSAYGTEPSPPSTRRAQTNLAREPNAALTNARVLLTSVVMLC